MSLSYENWDVRVHSAEAWISLAPRFASENPEIIDQIETFLYDPVAAVRLQVAQNLQVICIAAPDRMWALGKHIATHESDPMVLTSYLDRSMRRFSHDEPDRCETILSIVRDRMGNDLQREGEGRDYLQESFGGWLAQLYAGQGRPRMRIWLEEWASDPKGHRLLINAYTSSMRGAFFNRYAKDAEIGACEMCDRAQNGLTAILRPAFKASQNAYAVLSSEADEAAKKVASEQYRAAEQVIHHAMNQLYFGSGAHADGEGTLGLPDRNGMARFLADYAEILALLATSREPATLHQLIKLYEFLIPCKPEAVFGAIYTILLGHGEAEGYHFESLGSAAVVRIIRRYIADHRAIFEDEMRRAKLVQILQLFSEVGWTDALRLLYDLPDLLR